MLDKQMKPASWQSGPQARWRAALTADTVLTAAGLALAGGALAGEIKDKPRFTQGSDFSSLKDWHLKAETPPARGQPALLPDRAGPQTGA